jgi:hypothetical protein
MSDVFKKMQSQIDAVTARFRNKREAKDAPRPLDQTVERVLGQGPVRRYLDLRTQLINLNRLGGNVDPIMDRMDAIWCTLTDKEKESINIYVSMVKEN